MDEARFRHRGTIGWLVGDGEKAQVFLPCKMSPIVEGFGCRPIATTRRTPVPASESLQ